MRKAAKNRGLGAVENSFLVFFAMFPGAANEQK
jgi:hypothetical protein